MKFWPPSCFRRPFAAREQPWGLEEMDPDRFCRAPNDATSTFPHFRFNDEREFVGDADRIDDQQGSGFRHVANDAIESGSHPKNNQTALQRAKPRAGTMLAHSLTPLLPGPIAVIISIARFETATSPRSEHEWHQKNRRGRHSVFGRACSLVTSTRPLSTTDVYVIQNTSLVVAGLAMHKPSLCSINMQLITIKYGFCVRHYALIHISFCNAHFSIGSRAREIPGRAQQLKDGRSHNQPVWQHLIRQVLLHRDQRLRRRRVDDCAAQHSATPRHAADRLQKSVEDCQSRPAVARGLVKNRRNNGDHYWVMANVTPEHWPSLISSGGF